MHPLAEELRQRYERKGLVRGQTALPLHRACPNAAACWAGLTPAQAPADDYAGLSLPWVGPLYQPGGVLLVGINMNEHGGLTAWDGLIEWALKDLPRKDRLFASPTYAGSMLHQRGGWYAAVVLKHLGVEDFGDGSPVHEWNRRPTRNAKVIKAWEHIAATNQIKCSPLGGKRSRPTQAMWRNCAPLLLRDEITVLRPRVLLVLGADDNLTGLGSLGTKEAATVRRGIVRGVLHAPEGSFPIVALLHPAGYGGTSRGLVSRLDEALTERPL